MRPESPGAAAAGGTGVAMPQAAHTGEQEDLSGAVPMDTSFLDHMLPGEAAQWGFVPMPPGAGTSGVPFANSHAPLIDFAQPEDYQLFENAKACVEQHMAASAAEASAQHRTAVTCGLLLPASDLIDAAPSS